jgi:uncharacterized cysteine cluster protein YcgN (CxxCxxCC family)
MPPEEPPKPRLPVAPFWRSKRLSELTSAEWESLCDGCGRCCLVKLEDEDTGDIHTTDIACRLFDEGTCRCSDYENRSSRVPDCVRLTPEVVPELKWLPKTCGYRLVAERRDLPWWHPLVSGTPQTVIEAGISVLGRTQGLEDDYTLTETLSHIVTWPDRWPRQAKIKTSPPEN